MTALIRGFGFVAKDTHQSKARLDRGIIVTMGEPMLFFSGQSFDGKCTRNRLFFEFLSKNIDEGVVSISVCAMRRGSQTFGTICRAIGGKIFRVFLPRQGS